MTQSHYPTNQVSPRDSMGQQIVDDWLDDPKIVALYLAILHRGFVDSNPKATPSSIKSVIDTADRFHAWLT